MLISPLYEVLRPSFLIMVNIHTSTYVPWIIPILTVDMIVFEETIASHGWYSGDPRPSSAEHHEEAIVYLLPHNTEHL